MHFAADYQVESIAQVAVGSVEVRRYAWSLPLDGIVCDPYPVLGLSLSAVPSNSQTKFQSASRLDKFLPTGKLVFRPAGVPLHCLNAGGTQRLILCNFDRIEAAHANDEIFDKLALAPPDQNLHSETVAAALKCLAMEATSPNFASEALMDALITGAVIDLLRRCGAVAPAQKPVRGGLARWQLRRIDETLREIDGPAPTVSMLAKLVGVCPRHLVRAFRQSTGSTVIRYIARARHARACELLATTELPLKLIAYKSGFATPSSFAAAFKREACESPGEYRNRNRARHAMSA